jgi:ankyrin repeat protein
MRATPDRFPECGTSSHSLKGNQGVGVSMKNIINARISLSQPFWRNPLAVVLFGIVLTGCGNSFGQTSVFDAAEKGDLDTVKTEVQAYPSLLVQTDYFGRTLLDDAVLYGQLKVVSLLLDHGADPNRQDAVHQMALHTAAGCGQLEIARLLLQHKADVNARAGDGSTPLAVACTSGVIGDLPDGMVKLLLSFGANVNARDTQGDSPLHCAAASDRKNIVRILLAHKADINAKDQRGWTPLHEAAANGFPDMATLLLANGANIDAKDNSGMTPLDIAAAQSNQEYRVAMSRFDSDKIRGQQEVVKLLLLNKSGYNIFDAAAVGDFTAAEAMVQKKAAIVFSKDSYGKTPLHYAATLEKKDLAEFLLSAKADVNAKDSQGETPLLLATYAGRREVVELLLSSGADVNARDNMDVTPLHMAATIGHNDAQLVEMLLNHGADVNAKTKAGHTPLEDAMRDSAIAKLLVAHGGHF